MTDLVPYAQQSAAVSVPSRDLDSWINAMGDVAKLADYISQTEFVPDPMRGRPAAVAAAILTGREMGIPPMQALRNVHVVKGKPGLSAELMRAQVLAAGHSIRILEASDSRCVMEGRRRNDPGEPTRVSFTADQARKARIDLGGYPEDKLVARATTRLCRRLFADVVAGLPSVDELEDATDGDAAPATKPTRRTAKRTQPPAKDRAGAEPAERTTTPSVPQAPASAPAHPVDDPPLPDELDNDQPAVDDPPDEQEPSITRDQSSKLHAIFTNAGYTGPGSRNDRLRISSGIVNRELATSNDLTKSEASVLIDTLEQLDARDRLADDADVLLAAVTDLRTEQQEQDAIDEHEQEQLDVETGESS